VIIAEPSVLLSARVAALIDPVLADAAAPGFLRAAGTPTAVCYGPSSDTLRLVVDR
jgi:hypothetical protein